MPSLLDPITIGQVTFRNRIALPPMVRMAPHMTPDVINTGGEVTSAVVEHYARRARAGTGLVIVEATCVDPSGRVWKNGLNAYSDDHVAGLARLAAALSAAGAVPGIQLVHGGPQGSAELNGGDNVGPSPVASSVGMPEPRPLTIDEIHEIEMRFADGAVRAASAGFRFIEMHGAHGYLLDSFLSPKRNVRKDAYGQTIENRARIVFETCRAARDRVRPDVLIGCRISVFNKAAEGFGLDDTRVLVQGLEASGVGFVDLSTDGVLKRQPGGDMTMGQIVKEMTGLPTVVAGDLAEPADAERAIAEGHGDIAAVGRAMLRDPDWSSRVA